MQTIVTKYHGQTDRREARISATSTSGEKVYVDKKYDSEPALNHERAARALMKKLNWTGKIAGGTLKRDGTMVWVFVTGHERDASRDPARRRARPAARKRAVKAGKRRRLTSRTSRRTRRA